MNVLVVNAGSATVKLRLLDADDQVVGTTDLVADVGQPDPGELAALWHLEGAIERTLPEVFAPDYQNTIDGWKQKLRSQVGL